MLTKRIQKKKEKKEKEKESDTHILEMLDSIHDSIPRQTDCRRGDIM